MKEKFDILVINPNLVFFQPTNFALVGMFNKCVTVTTLQEPKHYNHEHITQGGNMSQP
jgi:hypothetical protein